MTAPQNPTGQTGQTGQSRPRSRLMRFMIGHYGAGPLHLLALLGSFAFAGYVVNRLTTVNDPIGIGIWFVATLVAHDLALFPLYALADRSLSFRARRHPQRLARVPSINHIRVPVIVSGILLLISFPLVFKLDVKDYHSATGLNPDPYLGRWLLITAVAFAGSAILYAIRLARAGRAGTSERSGAKASGTGSGPAAHAP